MVKSNEIKEMVSRGTLEMSAAERMDVYEAELVATRQLEECPLKHQFTPGLYSRMIFMREGLEVTSLVHKTCHQFAIIAGAAEVFTERDGWVLMEAPFTGVTYPGTRRALRILRDCIFITFHPTDVMPEDDSEAALMAAVQKVKDVIIEPRTNNLIEGTD